MIDKVQRVREVLSQDAPSSADLDELARRLLGQAPFDFLEQRPVDVLAAIVRLCAQQVAAFSAQGEKPLIQVRQRQEVIELVTVLLDRPFIVTSISEAVRSCGGRITVFLHPILPYLDRDISLTYLEIEPDRCDPQALAAELLQTLQQLVLVTDDFSAMLSETDNLAELRTRGQDHEQPPSPGGTFRADEFPAFLHWMSDAGFVFLGYAPFSASAAEIDSSAGTTSLLGLFHPLAACSPVLRRECSLALERQGAATTPYITKLSIKSPIHKRVAINAVIVPQLDPAGRPVVFHLLAGFLSSRAYTQESAAIPIVRSKVEALLKSFGLRRNTHDYKHLVAIIDHMPKEIPLILSTEALSSVMNPLLQIQSRQKLRLWLLTEGARGNAWVIIAMAPERFSNEVSDRLVRWLEDRSELPRGTAEQHADIVNRPSILLYVYLPPNANLEGLQDTTKLEAEAERLSRTWEDNLEAELRDTKALRADESPGKYRRAFPDDYQALYDLAQTVEDIRQIESLSPQDPLRLQFTSANVLSLYSHGTQLTLSQALPVLEHAGFEVISESPFTVHPKMMPAVFIDRFEISVRNGQQITDAADIAFIGDSLQQVFAGQAESDALNALLLAAHLDLRAIALLRTYCELLWQITDFASHTATYQTLVSVPQATTHLWRMFQLRFDPALPLSPDTRNRAFEDEYELLLQYLRRVPDITQDRILRALAQLVAHTVRTNFYLGRPAIALKVHSEQVDIMPLPRPLFEIFVRSPRMAGVHLRSARIARGGIRWSTRLQDFRTEILALMKTQRVKNALIVPNGAKGGFVIRGGQSSEHAAQEAYREFIRALLSITDNRTDAGIVTPPGIIAHDEPDPYLVVAADRGTAGFSDIANDIAVHEFDFWLGDAFASGGSRGYNHKKYGITARGTWESVKRHFHEAGIDERQRHFTVVGIGDMAGDVFGNGMILSEHMKLVAAFNHKHIFLDPNPDPARSFQERMRLFNLPQSQWSDYDPVLISAGGGVFERFQKEITLSREARAVLAVPGDVPAAVDGEQLISLILKAPCDLLFNGGIGTYVKARYETNAEVNDGTNDRVRVNADDLRAKIAGEGGNLGFTQSARIEFARRGGRINTDAVDNSGGVDLSDHEVNLKILLAGIAKTRGLDADRRNELLRELAPEVVAAVLDHNRDQALVLTLSTERSRRHIQHFSPLLREVSRRGYINRNLEVLPDEEELANRISRKEGLLHPELAVAMAAIKMWLKDLLLQEEFAGTALLEPYLMAYFPGQLQQQFRQEILAHPLAPYIAAMQVSNEVVKTVGLSFTQRMSSRAGVPPEAVLRGYLAASAILRPARLQEAARALDTASENKFLLVLLQELARAMNLGTYWLLSSGVLNGGWAETAQRYQKLYQTLIEETEALFGERYIRVQKQFPAQQLDIFALRSLALFPITNEIFEILRASDVTGAPVQQIAGTFSAVLESLKLDQLLRLEHTIEPANKWEDELLASSGQELRRAVAAITQALLARGVNARSGVRQVLQESPAYQATLRAVTEVLSSAPTVAAFSVIGRVVRNFRLAA